MEMSRAERIDGSLGSIRRRKFEPEKTFYFSTLHVVTSSFGDRGVEGVGDGN